MPYNNNITTVITGLGAVSGSGVGVTPFWKDVSSGHSTILPINPLLNDVGILLSSQLIDYDPESYFSSQDLLLLDRFSQFAVLASKEAIEDAGLTDNIKVLSKAAAIIGSGCGGKETDEISYCQLYVKNRNRIHPLTIPKGMPSAAASSVSLHTGIKGPVMMVSSACASGAHAVIQGKLLIESGLCEVAIVGASDAPFTYGLLKSWEALRVVSNEGCRPFSKNRNGLVLGEGAGVLVLESKSHALERGAKIYAEIPGVSMSSDAGHITRPDEKNIFRSLRDALLSADVVSGDIDYINAHGTGTLLNDATESSVIQKLFSENLDKLHVSSTKSVHGHALGASSSIELIATVLAIKNSIIPPTANFTEPDEGMTINYVPNIPVEKEINYAMSNSFAFGGLNAIVVLKRPCI